MAELAYRMPREDTRSGIERALDAAVGMLVDNAITRAVMGESEPADTLAGSVIFSELPDETGAVESVLGPRDVLEYSSVGDFLSGLNALGALGRGDTRAAGLLALGALPFISGIKPVSRGLPLESALPKTIARARNRTVEPVQAAPRVLGRIDAGDAVKMTISHEARLAAEEAARRARLKNIS